MSTVCVVGGAGYVGSVLVPTLLAEGYNVVVFDLFIYGDHLPTSTRLIKCKGDVRDGEAIQRAMRGCNSVIHLACISNDPSFELNPELGKSINYDSFRPLVRAAKDMGVTRFIYASSSSVYGVKNELEVTEDLSLKPLTDYSKYKAMCEEVLLREQELGFTTCILRPATVCGYSPRQRLDLVVNIMTNHAFNLGKITVFGGSQRRPNIHMEDMVAAYLHMLVQPAWLINGQVFNVGGSNLTLDAIANLVYARVAVQDNKQVTIEHQPSNDRRSYHISSEKLQDKVNFSAVHTAFDAIDDLVYAFEEGRLPNSLTDSGYFNIKRMQELKLQ